MQGRAICYKYISEVSILINGHLLFLVVRFEISIVYYGFFKRSKTKEKVMILPELYRSQLLFFLLFN
jgi:hypothetical protein